MSYQIIYWELLYLPGTHIHDDEFSQAMNFAYYKDNYWNLVSSDGKIAKIRNEKHPETSYMIDLKGVEKKK